MKQLRCHWQHLLDRFLRSRLRQKAGFLKENPPSGEGGYVVSPIGKRVAFGGECVIICGVIQLWRMNVFGGDSLCTKSSSRFWPAARPGSCLHLWRLRKRTRT